VATVQFIPFAPGRRPVDETRQPGLGASDAVAFVGTPCRLLLAVGGAAGRELEVTVDGVPRDVTPAVFAPDGTLREVALDEDRTYVLALTDLAPSCPFATQFSRRVTVGAGFAGGPRAEIALDVYDPRRFGSLYQRIVERLIKPDTERQDPRLSHAYHPWYPPLTISRDIAELYTRALIRNRLAHPAWLVRVGVNVEFLTALGIIEGVDPGLLEPEERAAFERDDAFEQFRRRINPGAWRKLWEAEREIVLEGRPRAGPVCAHNVPAKRRATVAFLRRHYDDLQQAMALAGPNPHSAQETLQRVFRDAERAVLRQTPDAFPELASLPPEVSDFVLWRRRGQLRLGRVPGSLPKVLGEQDGLFASYSDQYRASLNQAAAWARKRGLIDYTGEEAVPRGVSLLEAHVNQPSRVAVLQRRDGYDVERLEVGAELPSGYEPPLRVLSELLARTTPFNLLRPDEVDALARAARPLSFGPLERIIVQGEEGDSLYAVVEGAIEILVRGEDGVDVHLGRRDTATVLGEMSLLTGEPRSATVRAVDGALVYEISRRQLEPILERRPELVDALRAAMEERLKLQEKQLQPGGLLRRFRRQSRVVTET